jgi:integrase
MIALAAFAGIRTAELRRLNWHDIDLVRGYVNIAATKAKTAQRRLIKMEPNLLAWLAPFAKKTGPLWTGDENLYMSQMTRREQVAGITMPHNCLRHSFASYHLAKYQDAARLSLDMGHTSPKLIFNTYREVVYPEAAEKYFAILPPTQPENIISMHRLPEDRA